jgi:hypothetical protein
MSYQERCAIALLLTTLLLAVVFLVYVLPRYPAGNAYSASVFHFWGWAVIVLLPVSIAATIVFTIVYTIATKENTSSFADERDQFIALRATQNAIYVFTGGFFLAMGSLTIDQPPSVRFIIVMVSVYGAGLVSNISAIFLYRRGG